MLDNVINPDQLIKQIKNEFGEQVFWDAVAELENNDIIYEGQFPFLNDSTMRKRNFNTQKTILKRYGYCHTNKLLCFGFEVEGNGWMHCFVILGKHFKSTEDVKQAVLMHFS